MSMKPLVNPVLSSSYSTLIKLFCGFFLTIVLRVPRHTTWTLNTRVLASLCLSTLCEDEPFRDLGFWCLGLLGFAYLGV